ncbi:putative ribonuclease H-like domain-containing protein, partial [Tanacetum coccineum]
MSTIKLPILNNGEYDIWAIKMEHYLAHTDYLIWEVIKKGNGPVSVSTYTNGVIKVLPPKTAKETLARERERKSRTTLLMALPEDHLVKFHKMTDVKEMWDAIKSIFGGNDESKKMQKYIQKQQFEGFSISNFEGLHKGYDRFQSLLSQLEIQGAGVSTKDANKKFFRSLPSSWSQVSLVMRTKPGVDSLSFNDLYNNLRVFEYDVKGSNASSYSTQNVAFVSSESTNSTNDVSTAYGASPSSCQNLQRENSSSYTDDLISKGNQDNKRRDVWNSRYKAKDNGRRPGKQEESKALVTLDAEDTEVTSCSKECVESYTKLKKLYDEQREQLGDASIEIQAYTQALKKVEAQLVAYQQNQLWYEEKIRYIKFDLDDKTDVLTYHKKLLAAAEKEKEELQTRLEKWQNSSKGLNKLLNSQMSVRNKAGLGCGDQVHEGILSYEKEVFQSVFNSRSIDTEDSPVNDRYAEGMHAVPPPMTGIYIPSRPDKEIDESQFTYGPKQSKPSESDTRSSDFNSYESNSSEETLESMLELVINEPKVDDPHKALKNKWIIDSGCSKHMTGNKAYLAEYQDYNGGLVTFGGSKGYITGKGKIKTRKIDFEDVSFMKELQQFNLFSVSQMCDKKNKVLFTDTECLVLSLDFKLPDENQVLLRVPRQNNMYSFNLENIVPTGGLACLITKATTNKSNKWHRRLGHVNFKTLNKLVKGNLVRGLPSKIFQNDHNCVACQKGKQHKASCKAKSVSSISQPLQLLHIDLFGPTSVRSINHKTYCQVINDDFSRFSWVFFLRTKDETSGILKDFIRQIENQLNKKVKTIRCDNGTEFKNRDMIEFCGSKGIKREYSNAKTPQQNGVAERKNKTLIEAARTMLADSFLPNTFWAEAVNTACYVLNRVLVTKPHNKTPYELITGKIPIISYIRPFGCHVTILNTIDHLGKFEEKADEGFLVGYSLNSKAFRVYNLETKRVEENLHINFLENKPNVAGKGPTWLFDLDYLTDSMNYQPVRSENQANKSAGPKEANHSAGTQDNVDTGYSEKEAEPAQDYCVLPIWSSYTSTIKSSEVKNGGKKPNEDTGLKPNEESVDQTQQAFLEELERLKRQEKEANDAVEALRKEFAQSTEDLLHQARAARDTSTNTVNTVSTPDIYEDASHGMFSNASYDDEGAVVDFTNLENIVNVSPIPKSRIHSILPTSQILGDPKSAVQTRSKVDK